MKMRMGVILLGALAAVACGDPTPPQTQTDAGSNVQPDAGEGPGDAGQNLPPVLKLETPLPAEVLSGESATLSGTATDEGGPVQVEYSVDEGATWTAATVEGNGSFSVQLPLPQLDYKPWRLQVRATDSADAQVDADVGVLVDTVGPVCDEVAPKTGDFLNLSTPLPYTIKFGVSDGSGVVQNASISIVGWDDQAIEPATVSGGLATAVMPTWPSEEDQLTYTLTAEDASGNACEHSVSVTWDMYAPPLVYLGATHFGPASMTEAYVYGTTVGNGATITVDFDDGAGFRPASNVMDVWSLMVPLGDEDNVKHDLVVRAVDPAGNVTEKAVSVWVDRVAPVVTFTAPAADQKFNALSFAGTSDVPVLWTVTDGDTIQREVSLNGGAWTAQTADGTTVTTTTADNGKTYSVQVRATDATGNETIASRSFHVDRVAPTVTLDRTPNSRLAPRTATFTFSEPVDTSSVTFTTTPTPPSAGQWNVAGTTHTFDLEGDTVYDLKVAAGGFSDTFGNPSTSGASAKFHTELVVPATGTVLSTGVTEVAAAADQDGAVTMFLRGNTDQLARIDTKTGALVNGFTFGQFGGTRSITAAAWRNVLPNLSSERVQGYHAFTYSCIALPGQPANCTEGRQSARLGATSGTIENAFAGLVVVPPSAIEPAGLPSVAHVDHSKNYVRGSYTVPTSLLPWTIMPRSSDYWELLQADSTGVLAQARVCSCPPIGGCGCSVRPVRNLTTEHGIPWSNTTGSGAAFQHAAISAAATPGYRLYAFTSGTQRYEVCEQEQPQLCPFPCNLDKAYRSTPAAEGLKLAPRHSGNLVLGARKLSGGVELLQRDLSAGCSGQWTVLGTAPGSTGATSWHPILMGKTPALLYVVGGDLKTYVP